MTVFGIVIETAINIDIGNSVVEATINIDIGSSVIDTTIDTEMTIDIDIVT